ncbi:MAG: Omp28-related outer membrane protein, partial [Candidatus Syntrophosphaera sp.]
MKRTIILIMLLLGMLAAINAVPRNLVVVEVATGTWCGYCPGAAMGCHDLLDNGHAVAIVKNHGSDSFANVYSNARNSFYGVTGYPTAYFDGLNPVVGGSSTNSMYSSYLPRVNTRLAIPSHYNISALGSQDGDEYSVMVTVTKPEADTNTNVKLHAVLTESDIPFTWFNQTTVENVNRLMVPDQNGTAISLDTGGSTSVNLTFTPNASWNLANCEMVFFLQNMTSKEILQGVKYDLPALVGAYPVSHETIDFPDTYLTGSVTVPITIANFAGTAASGTISIDNPVFTSSASTFDIPPAESITVDIT